MMSLPPRLRVLAAPFETGPDEGLNELIGQVHEHGRATVIPIERVARLGRGLLLAFLVLPPSKVMVVKAGADLVRQRPSVEGEVVVQRIGLPVEPLPLLARVVGGVRLEGLGSTSYQRCEGLATLRTDEAPVLTRMEATIALTGMASGSISQIRADCCSGVHACP